MAYYEVREWNDEYFDNSSNFNVPMSDIVKIFGTKIEAENYINAIRSGSISRSMLVNDLDNLFIQKVG